MIRSIVPRLVLPLAAVAAFAAGCGTNPTTVSGTPAPVAAVPAQPVAATTTTHAPWSTAPVTVVHHPAVPPVPIITGARYAAHADQAYDRITFDIPGALPGYAAKYVTKVVADGSGNPIAVPGKFFLQIVFTPAQAHRTDGTPTISGVHSTNLPMLKAYAVAGDYEGYVTVALGLNAKTGYHIAELDNRIYIDVAA
jgi:hypothetical protein